MKQIQIPFRFDMQKAILDGHKTCTSRNKKYGNIGDWFVLGNNTNHIYELIMVSKLTLKDVSILYFEDEGFNTSEEFIKVWNEIHPRSGFIPEQNVWAHWFQKKSLH